MAHVMERMHGILEHRTPSCNIDQIIIFIIVWICNLYALFGLIRSRDGVSKSLNHYEPVTASMVVRFVNTI